MAVFSETPEAYLSSYACGISLSSVMHSLHSMVVPGTLTQCAFICIHVSSCHFRGNCLITVTPPAIIRI